MDGENLESWAGREEGVAWTGRVVYAILLSVGCRGGKRSRRHGTLPGFAADAAIVSMDLAFRWENATSRASLSARDRTGAARGGQNPLTLAPVQAPMAWQPRHAKESRRQSTAFATGESIHWVSDEEEVHRKSVQSTKAASRVYHWVRECKGTRGAKQLCPTEVPSVSLALG
jgi:hypothetical protein